MTRTIFHLVWVALICSSINISAQSDGKLYSAQESNYYQNVDYSKDCPECLNPEKTPRLKALVRTATLEDLQILTPYAFQIKIGEMTKAINFADAIKKDHGVEKVSPLDKDYILIITNENFDISSFESAGKSVFQQFNRVEIETYLTTYNPPLLETYLSYEKNK